MSTVGDTLSTLGDVQYTGGYHEYTEFREAAVLSRHLMVSSDIWRDIGNLIASSYSLAKVIARYKINK